MKVLKRLTALVLAILMVLSLSACIHKKDEIAVTVGDVEFTSAYYMCALISANSEAKQKVSESDDLSEAEKNGEKEIDYYSKKIDKKSFVKWVEDRAVEMLKEIAAYKTLCKENKIELTDEQKTEAQEAASYYWNNNGYSSYFGPNGVGEETYNRFTEDSYYAEEYFMSIYGEEGSKAIAAKKVTKEITDNYILVDVLQSQYAEDATDAQKKSQKETLEKNAKSIKNGEKSFAEIYRQINGIEEEEHDHDEDTVEPVNEYATILGAEGTGSNYESEYYDKFKGYKVNAPKVIELEDGSGVLLVIRRNINKDKYYMNMLDSNARHALADEEFDKEIDAYAAKLEINVNKYAVSQFKVKEIVVPEASY